MRHAATVAFAALASLSIGGSATAQLIEPPTDLPIPMLMPAPPGYPPTVAPTAPAPYFAPPAWSQTLAPNVRFVILSNFNNDAVLDRETGLVWTRRNVAEDLGEVADILCRALIVGNRMGWRLPVVAELQSLLDLSVPASPPDPRLPVGHPFLLSSNYYWANEARLAASTGIVFQRYVSLAVGNTAAQGDRDPPPLGVLCVRGPEVQGHRNLR